MLPSSTDSSHGTEDAFFCFLIFPSQEEHCETFGEDDGGVQRPNLARKSDSGVSESLKGSVVADVHRGCVHFKSLALEFKEGADVEGPALDDPSLWIDTAAECGGVHTVVDSPAPLLDFTFCTHASSSVRVGGWDTKSTSFGTQGTVFIGFAAVESTWVTCFPETNALRCNTMPPDFCSSDRVGAFVVDKVWQRSDEEVDVLLSFNSLDPCAKSHSSPRGHSPKFSKFLQISVL